MCFAIILICVYIVDKSSSENPNDAANIIVGISSTDSNSCLECQYGEIYYDGGCKRCIQDNVNFRTKTAEDQPFISSWSNDNGMFYGDKNCDGEKIIPSIKGEPNEKYWIEIHMKNSNFSVSTYQSQNYSKKISSTTTPMCSIPSELKFLRFSMNDGQPISNGGRLVGNIDNIEIYDLMTKNSIESKSIEDSHIVYKEDFSDCKTKTCNDEWVLQNPNLFYIDTEKNYFHFDSFVSGNNDYAHYKLDNALSTQEWIMRLVLTLDQVDKHPEGKGVLGIDPISRNYFLLGASIILVLSIVTLSVRIKSLILGIFILIFGTMLLAIGIMTLIPDDSSIELKIDEKYASILVIIFVSIFLQIYGVWKIKLGNSKTNLHIKRFSE